MTLAELKAKKPEELEGVAAEVRRKIIETVAANGGHLASSLGAVELTIGLLRTFDPPEDKVVWDVGHQAYAWKLLTDRWEKFGTLRKHGGLCGFPNPEESGYDAFVAGHAGASLAAAEGMAAARDIKGDGGHVVAVIGDAALTNGMALETLNHCTAGTKKMIVVVNDNAMSISRNVGAVARRLGKILAGVRYNRAKAAAERAGHRMRLTFLRTWYHRLERWVKSFWLGNALFESFGLRYIGPVDGHDLKAVEAALTVAKEDKRSVAVHVVTIKGKGFAPAEGNPTAWHGVGPFDLGNPEAGKRGAAKADGWSEVFGKALCEAAEEDGRVVGLTAAMRDGTGLAGFAKKFPGRFFDSGICEEHLVTFAAGLAKSGMRPVAAVYSTFLQRAVDQVMHDVCMLKLPVVLAVDRAGCVGSDGRTHHGMYDIAMLRCLPNLAILQPRNAAELAGMVKWAVARGAPAAIRYPRGAAPGGAGEAIAPIEEGKAEQVCGAGAPVQIWALGEQVEKALAARELLAARGVEAGVVNARFAKPFDAGLLAEQRAAGALVASVENGSVAGGFGEAIGADLKFGWGDGFAGHGTVEELEEEWGFTAEAIAEGIARRAGGTIKGEGEKR